MPSQSTFLPVGLTMLSPVIPGAENLIDLADDDIISIGNDGPLASQTTLAILKAFLLSPFQWPSRVVTSNAGAVFGAGDVVLLINKTVAGVTPVTLPTPELSRVIVVKDMKGDSGTNPITLDAGAGNRINGLQTLVLNANWSTAMLIGMSDTQWGTLI